MTSSTLPLLPHDVELSVIIISIDEKIMTPALKVDVVSLSNAVWIERLSKVDRWRRWV